MDDVKVPTIVKSFKKCCISNAMDGTEDDMLWEDAEETPHEPIAAAATRSQRPHETAATTSTKGEIAPMRLMPPPLPKLKGRTIFFPGYQQILMMICYAL